MDSFRGAWTTTSAHNTLTSLVTSFIYLLSEWGISVQHAHRNKYKRPLVTCHSLCPHRQTYVPLHTQLLSPNPHMSYRQVSPPRPPIVTQLNDIALRHDNRGLRLNK